uniref:Uncharacterized protein n=1 Tax=Micrurus lemniscatus lemniscatus TaxID=129467 RepID=A0A2D4H8L6_MICLE
MDYSWETFKAIVKEYKEQNPDQFHGSMYELAEKEILKKEEEWKKEEQESKETILTIQTVAKQENVVEEEAILNTQTTLDVLNVIKTRKGVRKLFAVKGGRKRVLKRKQNARRKKK